MKKNKYSIGNASYVGDLMADVGNRVGMKYGAEGSGANPSPDAFSQYGISSTEGDYNYSTVYSNLQSNKPILITAYANKKRKGIWPFRKTVYSGGHAWVIDGYKRKQKTFTYTYEWVLIKDDRREPLSAYNKYNPYYEEPQDYKNKLLPTDGDVYPGKREVTKSTSTTTYLTMNWGWDGFYDSGEYSISSSSIWRGSGNDYQYKKRILYNFR
ncbi:MAG: C10 family peptidase [Marinifilum sp.]|jgi:hypothetical protein|nr:C10 family peptidase [Marinifilum sp.]